MNKILNSSLHLLVKNEIAHLPKLLKYVNPWVDEIVIVDTGSTDGTLEVARQYTDKVFQTRLDHSFSVARNFGLSKVKTEWVFHLDADEWPTEALLHWLSSFVESRRSTLYEGVRVHRHNTVGGNNIGEMTHEWHTRLFRRNFRFEGVLHERININKALNLLTEDAPYKCVLEHFKSVERQERQNIFYEKWKESREVNR